MYSNIKLKMANKFIEVHFTEKVLTPQGEAIKKAFSEKEAEIGEMKSVDFFLDRKMSPPKNFDFHIDEEGDLTIGESFLESVSRVISISVNEITSFEEGAEGSIVITKNGVTYYLSETYEQLKQLINE